MGKGCPLSERRGVWFSCRVRHWAPLGGPVHPPGSIPHLLRKDPAWIWSLHWALFRPELPGRSELCLGSGRALLHLAPAPLGREGSTLPASFSPGRADNHRQLSAGKRIVRKESDEIPWMVMCSGERGAGVCYSDLLSRDYLQYPWGTDGFW